MKKTLIYSLIIAICAICALAVQETQLRRHIAVYKENQSALLDSVKFYRTEAGRSAASVQRLTLERDELETRCALAVKTAGELGVKLGRVRSAAVAATMTGHDVKAVIRDTVIIRGGEADTLSTFAWSDPWTDIEGEILNDSISLSVESSDTLVQIVHRVPHKFWFIKWGTKAVRQEIVSRNPHTKITYTDYIELKD